MRIHSKISGTKGLVSVYNEALRFRDMITPHAEERAMEKIGKEKIAILLKEDGIAAFSPSTVNGSEFKDHFEMFCGKEGITHFFSYPRSPKMNAEVERFNRTLSEAFIQGHRLLLAYDLEAFNKALMDRLLWYNTRRPHWSIGLISPLRYLVNK